MLLTAVLLTACRSGDDGEEAAPADGNCYLNIYVYAPDRPIVTRADEGEITATDEESKVNSLQIWVFRHGEEVAVGYLNADPTFLNQTGQQEYRLLLDKAFANAPVPVDVYVVANTQSCDLSFGDSTTRHQLDQAVIGNSHFGVSANYSDQTVDGKDIMVKEVPAGGLPMSAVATNQKVYGSFPTLSIGPSENEITVMQLTRAVSKLRFVLCRIIEESGDTKKFTSINSITLKANQIPTTSWLIKRETNNYTYNHDAINFGSLSDLPQVYNPQDYTYEEQKNKDKDLTAQAYEDIINKAVKEGVPKNSEDDTETVKFEQVGLSYLRESDLQLTGTINYTYKNNETENAEFSMAAPGDFLRNHSWTVYIYYMNSKIYTLTVTNIGMRSWGDGGSQEQPVYNW